MAYMGADHSLKLGHRYAAATLKSMEYVPYNDPRARCSVLFLIEFRYKSLWIKTSNRKR